MREIKFRCWHKGYEEYSESYKKRVNQMDYNPQFYDGCNSDYECDVNGGFNDERYHYMQYTGLKDKNGVEIYEGDIVRCITDDGELNGIVNYRYGSYYFGDYFLHNPYFDTVEVMANVYEGIKIK